MTDHERSATLRHATYEILEQGLGGSTVAAWATRTLVALILINLVSVALESVPAYDADYGQWFDLIEYVSLVVFTVEYLLRLWTAPEHGPFRHLHPAKARLRYAFGLAGLTDLIAVAPFWFVLFVPDSLRVLVVFRIVRFLKIARYSPAMRALLEVLYRERRALFGCLVILLGTALVSATLMYMAERNVQPDKLGTIPDALWWAIVTLGTVGYGDVVPITGLGRVVATLTIFLGLIMIALPVGIIATAFSDQIRRRDFVVTWGMIARVPLFAELDASEISEIMQLLRAQAAEAGQVVVRQGDPANSMFFIGAGEVEVQLPGGGIRLGVGQFCGEMAVLKRSRRSATVVAITRASLLALDAQDLHTLMERDPRVRQRIDEVMEKRAAGDAAVRKPDLVSE
ncbi:MAG: ion transporter [Pseudolabrys sp.]|nr:ion transporter [Pseudolabrys sp.]